MEKSKQSNLTESGIKLETITNRPDIKVPDCCRENWDDCIHKLPEEKRSDFNPI